MFYVDSGLVLKIKTLTEIILHVQKEGVGKNITRGTAEHYSRGASKEQREHTDREGGRRLLVSLYSGPQARLISI